MTLLMEPKDAINIHVDWIKNIQIETNADKQFVDALCWGYSLHPETKKGWLIPECDCKNTQIKISWPTPEEDIKLDDVYNAINVFTVPPDLPIAGLAEHLISFRRLLASNYLEVKNGESWSYAANKHIWNVCK